MGSASRSPAGLGNTIPALPVRDVPAAVAHYRERFGFEAPYEAGDFAVLQRDDAVLHLWGATDAGWRSRDDFAGRPIRSGAESFLAGTASCRNATDFGTREFPTLDLDGNLLKFFSWED